jgi:hypothetical protein
MTDFEYANGADGSCMDCGGDTDEPWHAYRTSCWRAQQGSGESPYRADSEGLRWQAEDRSRVVVARLIERLDELERRVAKLERERRAA